MAKPTLIIAVSIALAFAATEGGLRAYASWAHRPMLYQRDARLGYRLRPNLDARRRVSSGSGYFRVRTDAEGQRIGPEARGLSHSAPTLLLLGDSFAFGESQEAEETVSAYLGGGGYRVVNLGVPGYGPHQELGRLAEWLATHRSIPVSAIATLVASNDEEDVRASYLHMRHRPYATPGCELKLEPDPLPFTEWLVDNSFLYALLRTVRPHHVVHPGNGYAIVASCLKRIEALGTSVGARTVFITYASHAPAHALPYVQAATQAGVRLVDITGPLLIEQATGKGIAAPDGFHWNANGHRVAAEAILRLLAK